MSGVLGKMFCNRYKHYIFMSVLTTVEKSFVYVVFIACSCDKKNITRMGLNMQQKTKTLEFVRT